MSDNARRSTNWFRRSCRWWSAWGYSQFLLYSAVACLACDTRTFQVHVEGARTLSEATALAASREALRLANFEGRAVEPVCYWEDCRGPEKYLARTNVNAQGGYVLWRIKAASKPYVVNVRINRRGDDGDFECEIAKAK
jgi:hypothetical protein